MRLSSFIYGLKLEAQTHRFSKVRVNFYRLLSILSILYELAISMLIRFVIKNFIFQLMTAKIKNLKKKSVKFKKKIDNDEIFDSIYSEKNQNVFHENCIRERNEGISKA